MPPRRVRWTGHVLSAIAARAPWLWRLIRGPVQRFWDRNAGGWDERENPGRVQALGQALEAVGEPARILEIGSGTGSGTALLKARFPNAEVTGVDLSPEMVRIAQAKVPGVTFEPADAARLPFPDASFDLIAQNNVPVYFNELARVLARKRFAKLGFTDLRSEQAPPGDWFSATKS
jgi:SAM-dependent methyltransferase